MRRKSIAVSVVERDDIANVTVHETTLCTEAGHSRKLEVSGRTPSNLSSLNKRRRSPQRARLTFATDSLPAEHLRSSVWRSWNRCQAAGHEPKLRLEPAAIGQRRIHEVEERSRSLIVAAREELDHMASVVRGSGLVAMLADETGTIVHTAGDTAALSPRLRLAARQGMDLSKKRPEPTPSAQRWWTRLWCPSSPRSISSSRTPVSRAWRRRSLERPAVLLAC